MDSERPGSGAGRLPGGGLA